MKKISILSGFSVVVLVWIAFPYFVSYHYQRSHSSIDWEKIGAFGDAFGALNALFSGLALFGLAVSILFQISELKNLQLKEVDTAKKVAEQSNALRITALLHYYNNEIDRLERLSKLLPDEDDGENTVKKFWTKVEEYRARRDQLVKEIGL